MSEWLHGIFPWWFIDGVQILFGLSLILIGLVFIIACVKAFQHMWRNIDE